jgi:uncharacterized membrane-anchored protein YitT (DUF2179 family)
MSTVVATIFLQIMTELNDAESKENRIMVITKHVLKLMKKWRLEFIGRKYRGVQKNVLTL